MTNRHIYTHTHTRADVDQLLLPVLLLSLQIRIQTVLCVKGDMTTRKGWRQETELGRVRGRLGSQLWGQYYSFLSQCLLAGWLAVSARLLRVTNKHPSSTHPPRFALSGLTNATLMMTHGPVALPLSSDISLGAKMGCGCSPWTVMYIRHRVAVPRFTSRESCSRTLLTN